MHQVNIEELVKHISRPVREWDSQDITKWLTLNDVDFDATNFHDNNLSGEDLFQINPEQLIKKYGLTRFISMQIVEWIEEESADFDQYLAQYQDGPRRENGSKREENEGKPNKGINISLQQNQDKKDSNDVTERVPLGKWNRKKRQEKKSVNNDQRFISSPVKLENPNVKFVSSQFFVQQGVNKEQKFTEKKLRITSELRTDLIAGSFKIGRLKTNDLIFAEDSVSREHAEVRTVNDKGEIRYFLRDIKSKYGTYIGCDSEFNLQGCSFLIAETEITILHTEMRQPSPTNKTPTFDIVIQIDEKQYKFLNKSILIIGGKKNADIKIDGGSFKICVDRETRSCFLEAIEGNLYKKVKEFEEIDIEKNSDDLSKKLLVSFGLYKCQFEIVNICMLCNQKIAECKC